MVAVKEIQESDKSVKFIAPMYTQANPDRSMEIEAANILKKEAKLSRK